MKVELLSFLGRILRADIKMDDKNRSKGCGTVTFDTSDEALKCICIFSFPQVNFVVYALSLFNI